LNAAVESPLVDLERIGRRRYRRSAAQVDALSDVTLEIADGQHIAITEPSSSGKTTLLNIIGGVDRPTSGSVRVDGFDLSALSSDQLAGYRRRTISADGRRLLPPAR